MARIAAGAHEVKTHLGDYLNRAAYAGDRIVVERHGKAVAALVSLGDLQRLEANDHAASHEAVVLASEATFRSDMEASGFMTWPTTPDGRRLQRPKILVQGGPVSQQIVADRR